MRNVAFADWFIYALAIAALIIAGRVALLDWRARRLDRDRAVERATRDR